MSSHHGRALLALLLTALTLLPPAASRASEGESAESGSGPASSEVALPMPMERLDAVVDRALGRRELSGARIGVLVQALETGDVLYERNADEPFIPASNMKIVTAAALLDFLGPWFTYETVVSASSHIDNGVVGDLYVEGRGDPSLVFEEMVRLAESLRFRGLTKVEGDIVLDDSWFREPGPAGPEATDGDRAYHARVGALSFNFNAVAVRVVPGDEAGDPAVVSLSPDVGFVELRNEAVTASSRRRSTINVRRMMLQGRNVITVEGRVPAGTSGKVYYRSLDDPTGWFGAAFVDLLRRSGVEVGGQVRLGEAPDDAVELVRHESKPLSLLVRDLGKYSNNFIAEQLMLTLAAEWEAPPGTMETASEIVEDYLNDLSGADLNIGPSPLVRIVDGSGLSRRNRLSPRVIVMVLRELLTSFETSYEYGGSFSVSGTDGTLSDRMGYPQLYLKVRAKTGLLDGVTAVSGIVETRDDEEVLFSVLVNGFECEAWRSHDLEHAIIDAIREGRDD